MNIYLYIFIYRKIYLHTIYFILYYFSQESLKFTNKMHLALIKRYFMSLIFIMLSYIMIEIVKDK